MTSSGAPHGGHCPPPWSQKLPGVSAVRRREQGPGGPSHPPPAGQRGHYSPRSASRSTARERPRSPRRRSAEAVRLEAEWKRARSSLGGVPGAAAGFGLALCGTEASVPDGGLVAVCCGLACYSALKGAQQPHGLSGDDLFLHKPGALQACGEGSASFHPHPAPPAGTGQTADLFRTGNCSGQTEPPGFIPNASTSRRGNRSQGSCVSRLQARAAWPQRAALPPAARVSATVGTHPISDQGCHVHCDQALSFLLTPAASKGSSF